MRALPVVAVMTLAAAGATPTLAQQEASRSIQDGVFTIEQADQGKIVYDEKCGVCHGTMASMTPSMAPLLNDHTFRARWADHSLAELFNIIYQTMPQNEPGTLSPQELANLIAYILSANRLPAGDGALTDDTELLTQIRFEAR